MCTSTRLASTDKKGSTQKTKMKQMYNLTEKSRSDSCFSFLYVHFPVETKQTMVIGLFSFLQTLSPTS